MTSLNDQPITWGDFYNAYTGLKFSIKKSNDCRIFVPTYRNVKNVVTTETSGVSGIFGTEMAFRDEWSSQSLLISGSTTNIDDVFLKNLWEYAENNILWDEFKQQLSFLDVDVEETTLEDFVKNIDDFLVFHKLSTFGDVWWSSRVVTNTLENTSDYINVNLSTTPGLSGGDDIIKFWSPDKHINDEYKTYLSNPSAYSGFLLTNDFINGGWFTIPDLVISTKPFEKLKMADILLNLNFTFDPVNNFGHYYEITTDIGARLKDSTSSTVLDETQSRNYSNQSFYADTLISHWIGGLVNTNNIQQVEQLGDYQSNTCTTKNDEIEYDSEDVNTNALSHRLEAQMTLKPNYDATRIDDFGTIDPINWISAEDTNNVRDIGVLNRSRAFGGASGTRTNGVVTGGISNDDNNSSRGLKQIDILSNSEIWFENGFLKNVLISMNTPRCFQIQGGTGSQTCAVVGGYSSFETDDFDEFTYFSKSGVLNSAEVLVRAEDAELSYFKTLTDVALNVKRGDHAGYLNVDTQPRQDKFEVEQLIKNYDIIEDDEQAILQFVEDNSLVQSNYVRYAVSNINGFIYCGNTSGRSHLISTAQEDYTLIGSTYYDEVIDIFEKINTTNVVVSENELESTSSSSSSSNLTTFTTTDDDGSTITIDAVQEVISDVKIIDGFDSNGETIELEKCGKYRIEYIEGYYEIGADSVDITGNTIKEIVEPSFSVPNWDDFGPTLQLTNSGYYRLDLVASGDISGGDDLDATGFPISLSVDSSDPAGVAFSANTCGTYRIQYSGGKPRVDIFSGTSYYAASFDIYIDGIYRQTIWDTCYTSGDFDTFFASKPYVDVCVDNISASQPYEVKIIFNDPCDGDLTDNSGSVTLNVSYQGIQTCSCDNLHPIEVIVNDNLQDLAFTTNRVHTFCVPNRDSELRLRYKDLDYTNNFDVYGSIVVKVSYLGENSACDGGIGDDIYTTTTKVYLNDQYEDTIFDIQDDDKNELQQSILSRPTRRQYDFCTTNENSSLKLLADLNNTYNGIGSVVVRILYLGESDCNCVDPLTSGLSTSSSESSALVNSTNNATLRTSEITIHYITINTELKYPVRCHGLEYVGDEESGLSTGGRTEYNTLGGIDGVVERIYDKYKIGYQTIYDPNISQTELEKDRILDLVYELKNGTWIRRQNLFESVYWHCGVGNKDKAIFWGGVHESVGSYQITINNTNPDINQLSPDDFDCDDDLKTFTVNNLTEYGTDYTSILDGISSCWKTPPWNDATYVDQTKIFSDPNIRGEEETLQYSRDSLYPDFTVISTYPTNPIEVSTQATTATIDNSVITKIEIEKVFQPGEASFRVLAQLTESGNTTTGTFKASELDFTLESSNDLPLFPSNYSSTFLRNTDFQITDIQVLSDYSVKINYYYEDYLIYNISFLLLGLYVFDGVGTLTFNSMQDIYDSIINNTSITPTNHTFTIINSTMFDDEPVNINGSGTIKFTMSEDSGVMINVNNKIQTWSAPLLDCGPNISDFIELVANFSPVTNQRWGVPFWCDGIINNIGNLIINYGYDVREIDSLDLTGVNQITYEKTDLQISANNASAPLNSRLLIKGNTKKEIHVFSSLNNEVINNYLPAYPYCENTSGNATITLSNASGDNSYMEWSSSLIQEYQSDERYFVPEKWVPSNGLNILPSTNGISYTNTPWKRYMDGVGLGGDVPDYETIYDKNLDKLKSVIYWSDMNVWHVGQMCFGNPTSSVVVGGHKTDRTISLTGRNNNYHSGKTTERIFVWDLNNIPEEDTYLKNYIGRRLFTAFPTQTLNPTGAGDNSSLNVVIFEGESDIIIERQGTVMFDGSSNEQSVEFNDPLPDSVSNNYAISLTPSDNIEIWWEDKTTNGFTIKAEIDDFKGYVDYVISSTIKVTEEDIINNEPLEGFDFNN